MLEPALWAALATAGAMTVYRIVRRGSLKYALGGMFGVALSAFIASRTGNAANFYLPGLIWQGGYAVVYLVSILVGWPLIGVMLGPLLGEGFTWRNDPERRRAYTQVTWLWFGMFALRFAVQLPLYLLGDDRRSGLGQAGDGVADLRPRGLDELPGAHQGATCPPPVSGRAGR